MKKITLFLFPFILLSLSLVAQIRLDVENDAWIRGRLILGNSTDHNIFVGINAGISATVGTPNTFSGKFNTFLGYEAGLNNGSGYNNTFIGRVAGFSNTSGFNNTFIGAESGVANTTGESNTFVGRTAGKNNTIGIRNTFLGDATGYNNTTGGENTFIGRRTGFLNTIGFRNTFLGEAAGYNNTTGSENTFLGRRAGFLNDIGVFNTFIGAGSGGANTSGSFNTFVGESAGTSNTTGSENTFVGKRSGFLNSTGGLNTFFGRFSGYSNTTGYDNTFSGKDSGYSNTTGYRNTFIGKSAGYHNSTGQENTIVGMAAGNNQTTGYANSFFGRTAGSGNTTGHENTFLGASAGNTNTTGNFNTCVGTSARLLANNLTNATAIGFLAEVDVDNKVVIGNSSVTKIGGFANWMNLSDKRYKKKIQEENPKTHLDFILNLTPVSYQYNTVKLVKEQHVQLKTLSKTHNNQVEESSNKGNKSQETWEAEIKAAQEKDKIRYTGFLAQEVEKVANEVDYKEFSGIVKPDDNGGKYALRYAEFVVPLVGAIQEQQKQITERDQRIEQLETNVAELKELLKKITASRVENSQQTSIIESAKLGQNIPNPFKKLTTIPYSIPQNSQQATIQIHTIAGQLLKTISIHSFGEGTLNLQTTGLSKGQYTYTLVVDGRLVETKKMNLVQ